VILRAAAGKRFSLGVFALVQGVIDVEPVWNILTGTYPIHARLHTVAGAVLVGIAAIIPGKYALTRVYATVRRRLVEGRAGAPDWLLAELTPITWTGATLGGLLGGLSHPLLDAVIHSDVTPFAPWLGGNPLLVRGSFVWMHVACAATGAVGLALWFAIGRRGAGAGSG
jgi:hypothetical protein